MAITLGHSDSAFLTKATWRGFIKIQIELNVPQKQAQFLVYSEDKSVFIEFPSSKPLRRLLRGRTKAYFRATLLGDGRLNIIQEAYSQYF